MHWGVSLFVGVVAGTISMELGLDIFASAALAFIIFAVFGLIERTAPKDDACFKCGELVASEDETCPACGASMPRAQNP